MAEQIKMLLGMNTPRAHGTRVLIPHRKGGPVLNFGTLFYLSIFKTAEARDLKFCMRIEGEASNKNYAKLGHRESGAGSRNMILNFVTPSYLQNV